ncbi:thiamine-phosphate kinase [Methylocystis parvus]|uniref:Thiamine-monophosphate kinase n=1 Tax=Methylocystis parvus TaxID=134 RepID=A0A6B8M728_9HYPH|nr:thiamine-phosphate kinase [Methylocystis parvus]QGM98651.1 thiamine-phosphate kinase [Methylocystis parvus]WBK01001.1 thiamine-phosphate kinase [Methylocystis parvus OBBP]
MPKRYTEEELIARIFAPIAGPAALGLKDDAALIEASKEPTVATVDMLVAGVHFFADDSPALIAKKALRVNLSDLAAKGATPIGFLLSLALPADWTNDWLRAFASGLSEDAQVYAAPLIGGDTTATPGPLTISIAALGRTPRFVPRTGARPGDAIYVSGTIGDAALGLALRRDPSLAARLSPASRAHLLDRYLLPRPRLDLAPMLRAHANAAMDVSDGLAGDLAKLCRASGVGAVVEATSIPLSDAASELIALSPELFESALTGGDDYEILCTASAWAARPLDVVRIGEIASVAGPPIFLGPDGEPIAFAKPSFSHF